MFFKEFRNIVKRSDLFYSNEMLRYENELEYKSLTGGILSIALIVTVLVGFANMIILTMQRENITSTKEVLKHSDPPFMAVETSPHNNFMMGIQVYGVNLSAPISYFDYRFEEIISDGGAVIEVNQIPLIQCTKQHWSQLPQVVSNFEHLRIGNWLCPEIGFKLNLKGKYSSPSSTQYIFTIRQCVNSSTVTCASPQEIAQLFLDNSNQFYLTYFYINSIINENSKDFISYHLQDSHYVYFGDKIGAESYVYFADYTVNTDYSIWPFESIQTVTGSFVQSFWMNRPYQIAHQGYYSGIYAYIRLDKSSNSVTYNRQAQKISTVFSFIGGMISAISTILFIIKAYNSQAFQIQIASALFTQTPQKQQLKKNNFFSYLNFNLHKILKYIKCCPKSSNFQITERCLNEIQKQLDVKRMIQRIIFLQHCITFLFEDYQLQSILMKRPTSYTAIKKIRQRCHIQQKVVQQNSLSPNNLVNLADMCSSQIRNTDNKMLAQDDKKTNLKEKTNMKFEINEGFDDVIQSDLYQYEMRNRRQLKQNNQFYQSFKIMQRRETQLVPKFISIFMTKFLKPFSKNDLTSYLFIINLIKDNYLILT